MEQVTRQKPAEAAAAVICSFFIYKNKPFLLVKKSKKVDFEPKMRFFAKNTIPLFDMLVHIWMRDLTRGSLASYKSRPLHMRTH